MGTFWENNNDIVYLDELLNYLKDQPIVSLITKDIKHLLKNKKVDTHRINKCDINFPIILLKENNVLTTIIDGRHRLTKILQLKQNEVKCKILDLNQSPIKYQNIFKSVV